MITTTEPAASSTTTPAAGPSGRDDLELARALDGELTQRARTSDLIFPVPDLVERLYPLPPGDLIFTGTPAGVGAFRRPRTFLQPGQELTSWVEGIGELRDRTVGAPIGAASRGSSERHDG